MNDLKSVLERGVEGIEPASDWFESVRRRARRRERNRRLASGILVLLITAGVATGLWAALLGHERSALVSPAPSSELDRVNNQIAALTAELDQLGARLSTLGREADKLKENAGQIKANLVTAKHPVASARLQAQLDLVTAQLQANSQLIHQVELQQADVVARLDQLLARRATLEGTPVSPGPTPGAIDACQARDLGSRFVGGGLGGGNDFGSIVIWNPSSRPCQLAGRVTFAAYYSSGARDMNAYPNRTPPPVSLVLPAGMRPFHNGDDPSGYLTADLLGPERDDPTQPAALCRQQDKLSPATLVLTIGAVTFRVDNSDPDSLQTKSIYGCNGQVLLEEVVKA